MTEDRKRDGLILGAGIDRNAELTVMRSISNFGVVSKREEREVALRTIQQLGIHATGPEQIAGTLSGGNQQKLVIGKWLQAAPKILLLDEPTRGIDVGAKADIYRLIQQLAEEGMAIVLVSSELPELTLLSDRILVLREGLPTARLNRSDFSHETILEYASPGGTGPTGICGGSRVNTVFGRIFKFVLTTKLFWGLAVLYATGVILSPVNNKGINIFLSPGNQADVLRQVSNNGIIAVGMTLVILTGGIDLSVGSMMALGFGHLRHAS